MKKIENSFCDYCGNIFNSNKEGSTGIDNDICGKCLKKSTIDRVLDYFLLNQDKFEKIVVDKIKLAAKDALNDDILFEEFDDWIYYRDDESFLYLIDHYHKTKNIPSIDDIDRDLMKKRDLIIKASKGDVGSID